MGYLEELNIFTIVLQDSAGLCKTVEDSAGECIGKVGKCRQCRKDSVRQDAGRSRRVCQCGTV